MALKFLEEAAKKREAEYMSHVRPEFLAWLEQHEVITTAIEDAWFAQRGMNSYERELLYPKMDNEALLRVAENCLKHCSRHDAHNRPCSVYDDAMMVIFVPMMIERLKATVKTDRMFPEDSDELAALWQQFKKF